MTKERLEQIKHERQYNFDKYKRDAWLTLDEVLPELEALMGEEVVEKAPEPKPEPKPAPKVEKKKVSRRR